MTTPHVPPDLPIPEQQFQVYMEFWHAFYLGALAVLAVTTVWNDHLHIADRTIVLVLCILAQGSVYTWACILNDKDDTDPSGWAVQPTRALTYFSVTLLAWFIEWRLEPSFFWLIGLYLLHLLSLIPFKYAVAAGGVIIGLLLASELRWDRGSSFAPSRAISQGVGGIGLGIAFGGAALWYGFRIARTSSDRAQLIAALEAAQRDLETAHRQEAELLLLRERERLARDLHDNLGHALAALAVQLEAVQRLYPIDPARASAQINTMKALTRASMDDLRRSLAGLRSPGLGDRPLLPALQALCRDSAQRIGIEIICDVDAVSDSLGPIVAETIWRVVQETLTNVEKHAQAQQVHVSVHRESQVIVIRVADDGQGIVADVFAVPGRYGLRGMRERVEGLGGTVTITRNEPRGTLVEARLPLIGT